MKYFIKRMHFIHVMCILFFCVLISCQEKKATSKESHVQSDKNLIPQWASQAIWYQIFVERFRNGSSENDPTRASLAGAWPDMIPPSWAVTPWTQNWYQPDTWFEDCEDSQFYHGIQARRYGGDLIGVVEKLDYLIDLGINAIYFNPLNLAPSLHKYDPTYYHHIDGHFGPDPQRDAKLITTETHDDPDSWVWTSADSLFISLINKCHENDIRVIMDYSWNHTGRTFWAFEDVKIKGEKSKFKDWYYINSFDDPATDENEFDYKSWFGATTLPELKEDLPEGHPPTGTMNAMKGNIHSESLKQHIRDVTKRWMDPNNDGNPSDGVDGFRMDVAAEIPVGFWAEYSSYVKSINPQAILIGELWYEEWPDKLLDPIPFFNKGFDASMNYRWYRAARRFFAQAGTTYTPTAYADAIADIYKGMKKENQYAMMNLISGHDSPRALTSFFNKGNYKFQTGARDNKEYKIHKPDASTFTELKMLLVHQFTFIGAPHIWNGDEMGMWGSDDPDCRKPLWWPDLTFEDEQGYVTDASADKKESIEANHDLGGFYKRLVSLRKKYPILSLGDFEFVVTDDKKELLAYSLFSSVDEIIVCFNRSAQMQKINVPVKFKTDYHVYQSNIKYEADYNLTISVDIEPNNFMIIIKSL